MGVRRCLARSLTSLALMRTPKSANGTPQQFIPAGFPLHNQLPTGTEDSAIPLTTPDMVRSGRVLPTSVKSLFYRLMLIQRFLHGYCFCIPSRPS